MGARHAATVLLAVSLLAIPAAVMGEDHIQPTPAAVTDGFAVLPFADIPVPTAITFGPDLSGEAPQAPVEGHGDLYATSLDGSVYRVDLTWTPAGPVAGEVSIFAEGFNQPLGIAFDDDGNAYVSDSVAPEQMGRAADGIVYWIDTDGDRHVLVDNLPNGRHNTNNLKFHPDGRLFITNGNPNDNGQAGGSADVFPYSGAILAVQPEILQGDPAVLHWEDVDGQPLAADEIFDAPVNDPFEAKVEVIGFGLRNVYDVAFGPDGTAYTATNGADDPSSQDVVYRFDDGPGAFYGFPFCYDEGLPGATGDDITKVNNPTFPDWPTGFDHPAIDEQPCQDLPTADALIGWHVCATGADIPADTEGPFGNALYVGECTQFFAEDLLDKMVAHPTTHNTAHKVVRVTLDEDGHPTGVRDFVKGLPLPLDVHFGPQGDMYIADATGILRVTSAVP